MDDDSEDLLTRLQAYSMAHNRSILDRLGGGTDGTVWETTSKTAIKVLRKRNVYETERECYRRLRDHQIVQIRGYSIPRLVEFDDQLLVVEMDVVEPPRIIDFGKATLDKPWDFSKETMAYWYERQQELWGDHWPDIRRILSTLRGIGIYYADPSPQNITPENWDPEL